MIYLFSYKLLALDRHNLIRLARGKTNRQYVAELSQQPTLQELLRHSMVAFEDVFFGQHRLDPERFEGCWQSLDRFHQHLATFGSVMNRFLHVRIPLRMAWLLAVGLSLPQAAAASTSTERTAGGAAHRAATA
jgi:hypothetical protein